MAFAERAEAGGEIRRVAYEPPRLLELTAVRRPDRIGGAADDAAREGEGLLARRVGLAQGRVCGLGNHPEVLTEGASGANFIHPAFSPFTTGRMAMMCSGPVAQHPPIICAPMPFHSAARAASV